MLNPKTIADIETEQALDELGMPANYQSGRRNTFVSFRLFDLRHRYLPWVIACVMFSIIFINCVWATQDLIKSLSLTMLEERAR